MTTKMRDTRLLGRTLARGLVVLAAVAFAAGAPFAAHAEGHGGGGGGGGHAGGGGGGGHVGGGGHAAVGHFQGRPGGYSAAGHAYYGNTHYAAGNHVYGGGGYSGAGRANFVAHPGGGWHPGYGGGRGGFVAGTGRYWGGGYWGGRFWPGTHYGPGFAWFLPVLPFGYATYWWGGSPYYYYDNAYYAWDPNYNGYVATDPPPVAGGTDESGSGEPPPQSDAPQSNSQSNWGPGPNTAAPPGGVSDIYVYPKNGQSDEQTSNDRFECHKWAVAQTGFDPTRSANTEGNSEDYRRAIGACLDARGYSVK
jgi:hypothetical protein